MEEEKKETDLKENESNENEKEKEKEKVISDNKDNTDLFKSKIEMLRSRLSNNKSKYSLDLQASKTNYLIELSRMGKYHKLKEIIEMLQPTQPSFSYYTSSNYLPEKELFSSIRLYSNKLNYTVPKKDLTSSTVFNSTNKKSENVFSERLRERRPFQQETGRNFISNLKKVTNGIKIKNSLDNKENRNLKIKPHEHIYAEKQFYKDRLSKFSLRLFGKEKKLR